MDNMAELRKNTLFNYFEQVCSIKRSDGASRQMADFLMGFASEHSLEAVREECGNVIIKSPARGSCNSESIILHTHMDMLDSGSRRSPWKEGLKLEVMDDYIFALHAAMGSSSGMAIALCLSVLSDEELEHPPIEAVFTCDWNHGMRGASLLNLKNLTARRIINLNGTSEGEFIVGSAGRVDVEMNVPVKYHNAEGEMYKIVISGFKGGHSGNDINLYQGNANIIMGRLLHYLDERVHMEVVSMTGGLMNTAIPREADCTVIISPEDSPSLEGIVQRFEKTIRNEYKGNEPDIMIYCNDLGNSREEVLYTKNARRIIFLLNTVPDGVQKICRIQGLEGMVESSLNVGIMRMNEGEFFLGAMLRSNVTSEKEALSDKLRFLTETIGGRFGEKEDYPAWEYNEYSTLLPAFKKIYSSITGQEGHAATCHFALEGGFFSQGIEGADIISIGCDIMNEGTAYEKLSISSAGRTLEMLKAFLSGRNQGE